MWALRLTGVALASLGRRRDGAVDRLWSNLFITIIYSLILTVILCVCNVDSDSGYIHGAGFNWSDLELVKQPRYLNILNFTIGLGWTTLVLDFISAWCKSHDWRSHNWGPLKSIVDWFVDPQEDDATFWEKTVLLQTRWNLVEFATIFCPCRF